MNSVLLVDDEPLVLDGLRGAWRSRSWRMAYRPSAAADLDRMEVEPADVSNVRMPPIDSSPPAPATGCRRL
jgi:hypothetical protein